MSDLVTSRRGGNIGQNEKVELTSSGNQIFLGMGPRARREGLGLDCTTNFGNENPKSFLDFHGFPFLEGSI